MSRARSPHVAPLLAALDRPSTAHALAQTSPLSAKQVYSALREAARRGEVRKLSDDHLEYIARGRPRVRWVRA